LTKIIKQRIKKKKEFLKIKNTKFNNYLKIVKFSNRFRYIIKNIIIKDSLLTINLNFRIIKY